jgi:Oxysterol-binding protein
MALLRRIRRSLSPSRATVRVAMAPFSMGPVGREITDVWCLVFSVLSHIISQLRPGADLSRVVLPTFILEPRSMLERITK